MEFSHINAKHQQWFCELLRVSFDDASKAFSQTYVYDRAIIRKRGESGKIRELSVPGEPLRKIQRELHKRVLQHYPWPPVLHGFIPGRSFLTAARAHCGHQALFTVDFIDAFNNVGGWDVATALKNRLGLTVEQAEILKELCVYRSLLPQGAPSSPLVFNLVILDLTEELEALVQKKGWALSIYADEVAVSSDKRISREERLAILTLCRDHGFKVSLKKSRYQERQWGTPEIMRILLRKRGHLSLSDRKSLDPIRARLMRAVYDYTISATQIQGLLSWVWQVDPEKLDTRLRKPITRLREVRGLKIRINPEGVSVYDPLRALGGNRFCEEPRQVSRRCLVPKH